MKRIHNMALAMSIILSLFSQSVLASGGVYHFDPNTQRVELFEWAIVLEYGKIPESSHPSNCECLKAEITGAGWPDVTDKGTLRAWMGIILDARNNGERVTIYRSDDWKILSISPGEW